MNELAKAVLQLGSSDWVALGDIDAIQREQGSLLEESRRKSEALGTALNLLDDGMVMIGDVTAEGFEPWRSSQREKLSEVYAREDWKYAAWLCNTDLGTRVVSQVRD